METCKGRAGSETLSWQDSTIRTGESTTAAVTGFDADGEELDGSKAVITSENPDIAEVSGNTVIAKKSEQQRSKQHLRAQKSTQS